MVYEVWFNVFAIQIVCAISNYVKTCVVQTCAESQIEYLLNRSCLYKRL